MRTLNRSVHPRWLPDRSPRRSGPPGGRRGVRAWRSALLAALLTAGCAPRNPVEIRRDTVDEMGELVRENRESVPNPGPRWDSIEPGWRQAAIDAATPEEYRRALVRLVDRLDDGHAAISVTDAPAEGFPGNAVPFRLDRECWLGLHDGSYDLIDDTMSRAMRLEREPTRVEWIRLRAIDGYAFRTTAAAIDLLEGEPGTEVEISGVDARGREVTRRLTRVAGSPPLAGGQAWIAGDTIASMTLPCPKAYVFTQSKRLGSNRGIGYLRVRSYHSGGLCGSWFCNTAIDRCDDRVAIAAAADEVVGCDTIIIDLLGNGGGTCMHGSEILRHFLPPSIDRIPFAHDHAPPGGSLVRWPVDDADERRPRRIFLLVDGGTGSAAEHVAAILKGAPGVTVIGAPTAGCESSLVMVELAGGVEFRFGGVPAVWDPGFTSAECNPVEPDVEVPLDRRSLVRDGPAVAAVRRHVEILRKALELAEEASREG